MKHLILCCIVFCFTTGAYAQTHTSTVAMKLGDDQTSVVIKTNHQDLLTTDIQLLANNGETITASHLNAARSQQLTMKCHNLSDGLYYIVVSMQDLTVKRPLRIIQNKFFLGAQQLISGTEKI